MRRFILLIVFCLSASPNVSAQNLDKLLARARGYLAARAAVNKPEMAKYAPPDKRTAILDRNPPSMSKAQMEGFEFGSDPKTVYVRYSATFAIPDVGPITTQVREPWIWNGRDWFLKIDDLGNPFQITKQPVSPPPDLPFELSSVKIDLGKHRQGEVLRRTIAFKSDQDKLALIRGSDLKGLSLTGPNWTSKEAGQIELMLDTTLIDQDVHYSVELGLVGWNYQSATAKFEITAQIEPRLRFSQVPEMIDPASAGTAEIRIENLSNTSFKPTSLALTNKAYEVADYTSEAIAPGNTLKITIHYEAQPNPTGAVLNMRTSPGVLAESEFVLPLNVKLPVSRGAGYTKEELDEMLKRSR